MVTSRIPVFYQYTVSYDKKQDARIVKIGEANPPESGYRKDSYLYKIGMLCYNRQNPIEKEGIP